MNGAMIFVATEHHIKQLMKYPCIGVSVEVLELV